MTKEVKVSTENLPHSQIRISIAVPADQFDEFVAKAAQELSKDLKVPGFRSGKIPRDVVERNVGKDTVMYQGAEMAIRKFYVDAILDQKIEAIGEPKVDIKKISLGNDFEFEAIVAVMPKVKLENWQDDVQAINNKFKKEKVAVKEEEVQKELDFLANQRAKIITVNRQAAKGDQVEIDFSALKNNVPIENGTAKKQLLIIGQGKFIPGFEDHLVGLKAGDEKKFELEFPKNYHEKNLAGQKATFEVKVNLVQERQVPMIDDEFAKGIGKFESLDLLKSNIKEGIEHEQKHKQEDKQKKEIIKVLVDKIDVDPPEILIDNEIKRMMAELEQDLSMMGLDKEKYFDQVKTSEESLTKQWKSKEAVDRIKAALALREIASEQQFKPSSKEIEERMNKIMQYYKNIKDMEKKIDMERLYESVKGELTNEMVFRHLMK